jgi:tetratricopeptide (TPR) repeat protein
VRGRILALLGFLVLALVACQAQAPTPPQRVEENAYVRATAALEAGRYPEAVDLFRRALERAPESLPLHYGLAVSLSYVNRGAAGREFQWVMAKAPAGSPEATESRQWLTRAGLLPQAAPALNGSSQSGRQTGNAVLVGRALSVEKSPRPEPMRRLQLFLVGQPDSPTKEERYTLRTGEDGSFKFPNVVPGPYMLTNRVAGQPIWRLRVELKPAEEKQLDLTSGNSASVRDDFPLSR